NAKTFFLNTASEAPVHPLPHGRGSVSEPRALASGHPQTVLTSCLNFRRAGLHRGTSAILTGVLACMPLLAQKPPDKPASPPAKADEGAVFVSNTRLVVLHATVLDKNGHLVTTLQKSAFQVYENDALQSIKDFKREDVPVSMGLIVDNSGSMRDKREKVKE